MIDVNQLSKHFGNTQAVDRVSFHIRRGEVVGFLGPNGAGKTTTMRLLTRYLHADEGTVRIENIDVEDDPLSVRRRIGYLPESAPLYHDLNVIEYLRFVAAIRAIPAKMQKQRLAEVVQTCGLETVLTRDIGVLSKGYRQRVGLAQTLIHDPDILILDEPTSGLDPNQIVEIRDMIRAIGQEKTIIISSHILAEVQATCGRVLIINQGRIVGDGTPNDLAEQLQGNPRYYMLAVGKPEAIEQALKDAVFITHFEGADPEGSGNGVIEKSAAERGVARQVTADRGTTGDGIDDPGAVDRSVIEEGVAGQGPVAEGAVEDGIADPGAGAHGYRVFGAANETRLGEKLFHLANERGFALAELRRERCSLEAVFSRLTQGEVGA